MREIKFRAWDLKQHYMFYGIEDYYDDLGYGLGHKPSPTGCSDCFGDFLETDQQIVMQYTGLKDKNDKEIYEGDLVTLSSYPWFRTKRPHVVEWNDYACGFEPFCKESGDYGYPPAGEWAEVIGNIYENPELLKED